MDVSVCNIHKDTMIQYSSTFSSSNYSEKVDLQLSSNILTIHNLPADIHFDDIMIVLTDEKHNDVLKETLHRERGKSIAYKFPNLTDGDYYLNIYYKSFDHNRYYEPFIFGACITLNHFKNLIRFCFPLIVNQNKKFLQDIKTDSNSLHKYTKPSFAVQSYDSEVIKKAKEITRFSHSDYHRSLSIHNWAARNLFYDYDSLIDDAYKKSKISATDVLKTGKSVCQGYTELTIAMMRSLGIPAIGIRCFVLSDFSGGWNNPLNLKNETNHIFTAAFVNNRWVLMDCTWDSPNRFEKNQFQKLNTNGLFTKYFDPTIEFMSASHRFVEIFI